MSKFCTSCGAKNPDEAKFCRKCGKTEFTNKIKANNVDNTLPKKYILNEQIRIEKNLESTDNLIKEFDKQFRKCIAQQILPNHYLITSDKVRDMQKKEEYITTISNMQLCLMKSNRIIQTYEINDEIFSLCKKRVSNMIISTFINIKNDHSGFIFLSIIIVSLFFLNNVLSIILLPLAAFFFIPLTFFILIKIKKETTKKNDKNINLFSEELIKFIENNYKKKG